MCSKWWGVGGQCDQGAKPSTCAGLGAWACSWGLPVVVDNPCTEDTGERAGPKLKHTHPHTPVSPVTSHQPCLSWRDSHWKVKGEKISGIQTLHQWEWGVLKSCREMGRPMGRSQRVHESLHIHLVGELIHSLAEVLRWVCGFPPPSPQKKTR